IAPWEESLVPETCRWAAVFASLIEDSVRRAKADFPLVPLCSVARCKSYVLQSSGPLALRCADLTADHWRFHRLCKAEELHEGVAAASRCYAFVRNFLDQCCLRPRRSPQDRLQLRSNTAYLFPD